MIDTAVDSPTETLITHAWGAWEQEPRDPKADLLREAVWRLEEAADTGRTDELHRLGREVIQTLAVVTGDEITELLAPMPSVAAWLGL